MADDSILEITKVIQAGPGRVFEAWTTPADLKQWWGVTPEHTTPLAEVDLQVGGHYRLTMRSAEGADYTVSGEFIEVAGTEHLAFSWQWEDSNTRSRVTINFHEKAPGFTELVLIHEGLTDSGDVEQHRHGWLGCLEMLNRYLTG